MVVPRLPVDAPSVKRLAHLRSGRLREVWGPVLMGEGESCSPIRLSYHHIHVQDAAGEITSNLLPPFHADTEDWGAVSPGVFLVDSSVSRRFPLFHLKIGRSLTQFTSEHLTRIMSTGNALSQKTALEATLGVRLL